MLGKGFLKRASISKLQIRMHKGLMEKRKGSNILGKTYSYFRDGQNCAINKERRSSIQLDHFHRSIIACALSVEVGLSLISDLSNCIKISSSGRRVHRYEALYYSPYFLGI